MPHVTFTVRTEAVVIDSYSCVVDHGYDTTHLLRDVDTSTLADLSDADNQHYEELQRQVTSIVVDGVSVHLEPSADHDPWVEDVDYPVADWCEDVANDATRRGYAQWVVARREADRVH